MSGEMNSRTYWDARFSEDWKSAQGPFQTEMFARVALRAMPRWLQDDIRRGALSILDVGCAEGEAVNLLAQELGVPDVCGCDFSQVAIDSAKQKFPGREFFCHDATTLARPFNVVFCSNVVEHFQKPLELVGRLSSVASDHVIVQVPIWEMQRHEEHEATFLTSSFPAILDDGKVLSAFDVVNTATYPVPFWNGWQAIVVYSSRDAIARCGLNAADLVEAFSLRNLPAADVAKVAQFDPGVEPRGDVVSGWGETGAAILANLERSDARREQIGWSIKDQDVSLHTELKTLLADELARLRDLTAARMEEVSSAERAAADADVLRQQMAALRDEYASLDACRAEEFARLQMELADRQSALQSSQVELEGKQTALDGKQAELQRVQADLQRVQAALQGVEAELARSRTSALARVSAEEARQAESREQLLAAEDRAANLAANVRSLERALELANMQLNEVYQSTSWRITAPARQLVTGLRGLRRQAPQAPQAATLVITAPPVQADVALPDPNVVELDRIVARHAGKPIIVLPALVDWDLPLFQRPHHIASQLARKGYLYFFCTWNVSDKIYGFKEIEEGLYVTDQHYLVENLPGKVLHLYSTDNLRHLDFIDPRRAAGDQVLYEYIDEIDPTISGMEIPEKVWEKHKALVSDESVVCVASADKLLNEILEFRQENVVTATNGVDIAHFRNVEKCVPDEIADLVASGKPIIGYFGAFAVWFDYELVCKVAEAYPDYQILLIGVDYDGSIKSSRVGEYANIKVIGPIPYLVLPRYAQHFAVSTIPFVINAVTESTSPIKLFEYMALGHPIVTTAMPECRKYQSAFIGEDHDDFVRKVGEALGYRNDQAYRRLLDEEALQNTWASKAGAIDAALAKL